ncbi:hypothetical protein FA95DRAFT_1596453 [Auriscalpium vulgare]|uniref:Uncharacterized protein n=1 Tax=Auriscalpium vulgare TaxID=40419 RepID=A0ACB8RQQ4_9AGAM|nr:hypothetical protein FA95DRAFT_1596453 [Auriscalpium vulgare]
MSLAVPHYELYSRQLYSLSLGAATWECSPQDQIRRVLIGDVGYMFFGRFTPLFNVHLPADHRFQPFAVPPHFEPLEIASSQIDFGREVEAGAYCSQSIRALTVDGQIASAPSPHFSIASVLGGSVSFQTNKRGGAVLTLPYSAKRADGRLAQAYEGLIRDNYDSWFAHVKEMGFGVSPGGLILVTGCDVARAWGAAVTTNDKGMASRVVQFSPPYQDLLGVSARVEWVNEQHVMSNSGPADENLPKLMQTELEEGDPQWLKDLMSSGDNECVFVRGYRMKRRGDLSYEMPTAFAEYKETTDQGDDEGTTGGLSQDDGELELEGIGQNYEDPTLWTPLLDYILTTLDVDLAIVHDDDLIHYLKQTGCEPDPQDIAASLAQTSPECHVLDSDSVSTGVLTGQYMQADGTFFSYMRAAWAAWQSLQQSLHMIAVRVTGSR